MTDLFDKANKFINGKMTERPSPGGTVPSPPSTPGDNLQNRKGDIILASVTNNEPSLPVDTDQRPTLATLYVDPQGRLRVLAVINGTVTISGAVTIAGQPISVNVANTPAVTISGQPISVSISGQPISVSISGQPIAVTSSRVNTYSAAGFATTTNLSGQPLASLQNPGGSTKTVRVRKIYVHIHTSGTAAGVELQIFQTTSLTTTTGSIQALTPIRHDSNNPVSACFNNVQIYTTTTTTAGGAAGPIRVIPMNDGAFTANPPALFIDSYEEIFDVQPITLHPGQEVNIQLSAVVNVQTIAVSFEWTEE